MRETRGGGAPAALPPAGTIFNEVSSDGCEEEEEDDDDDDDDDDDVDNVDAAIWLSGTLD